MPVRPRCWPIVARREGARVEYNEGSCDVVLEPAAGVAAASAKVRARYELRALNPEDALRWYDQLDRTVQQLVLRSAVIDKTAGESSLTVAASGDVGSPETTASSGAREAAGTLIVKAQGSQHWRVTFGYAFEGALRLYAAEGDCPHDTSGALVDVAADAQQPDLKTCLERLDTLASATKSTICANVSADDIREFADDEEYWSQLGQTLSDLISSEQWQLFCSALPTLLDSPEEADPPRHSRSRRRIVDFPLAVVDLSILDSDDSIHLTEAEADDVAHITIKSEGRALRVRGESLAATTVWHTRLQGIWHDAAGNLLALQRLPNSVLISGFDSAGAGDPALGRSRTTVESDRSRTVEEIFERRIGPVVGGKEWVGSKKAVEWPKHIADHVQPVIEQAEHLLDEMALGLVQAASRQDVADWWVTTFYSRFMDMLRGFSTRTPPVSGDIQAYDTNDAIAIIHWCKQFRERCDAIGIDPDVFETDPTEHGVYQALSNAHMPSYRGQLHKKNASLGWSKRYYALGDGCLRYFSSELMEQEHGCIPGEMITFAQIDTSDKSGRTFSITGAGKLTELYAASSDEALVWVERINKARDAAAAMERMAAARTCFEVEVFDGHREVGVAKVHKDCNEMFDAALRDVGGANNSSSMMRFTEAADLLVDQLEVRVQRIPDDRPDVTEFFVGQYHTYISKHMLALVAPELSEWKARDVCHFLFWARRYDKAIGMLHSGPMEQPLAAATQWDDVLPGFTSHQLPKYTGWIQQQYKSDRSWNRVWLIIEDSVARWYSDEGAHHILGTMVLPEDADVNKYTEDNELYQLTVRTTKDTLYLQVSSEDIRQLLSCLVQSIHPVLPGESVRSSLDDDNGAIREAVNAWLAEYRGHSPEELQNIIKGNFAKRTQDKVDELRSRQPAQEFGLEHVLELFTTVLDELVDIVDAVLLTTDDDTGESIEMALVHFHITTRHKLLEESTKQLCDPERTVMDSGCNVVVDKNNVAQLLRWIADYSSRMESLGVTIQWNSKKTDTDAEIQSTATVIEPLQFWCQNPMAEFVEVQRIAFSEWLANLDKVQQQRQQEGRAGTSLPMDLFKMIHQTTRTAAESASQWMLVNTVMGVIIPQVRLWASDFEEQLTVTNKSPEYFCACMNDMYESQRLFCDWSDELETRISMPEMMSDNEANELQVDSVSTAIRAILNAATERLCEVLFASDGMAEFLEALMYSNRRHPASAGIPDWPGDQMIRPMLDNLRSRCGEMDGWLTPRMFKRASDQLMATSIQTYEQHLLMMSRAPTVRGWGGRQGHRRTPAVLGAFVSADVEHLQEFFVERLNLREPTVRTALQRIETISQLLSCDMENFEAEVQKAAIFPEFTVDTVQSILEARKDVEQQTLRNIVRRSRSTIKEIHEAINPTLPRRPAGGPIIAPRTVASQPDDGSPAATPRVIASYSYKKRESDDLSFEPGKSTNTFSHTHTHPHARHEFVDRQ
eukprot:COSAG02_NODE_1332_length_13211_cov_14.766397_2_plen_1472_part_00